MIASRSHPPDFRPTGRRRVRSRRGSTYLAVVGLSLLVVTVGLTGLATTRSVARGDELQDDWDEAGVLALGGVEAAVATIRNTSDWRKAYVDGSLTQAFSIGTGSVTWRVLDGTGSELADEDARQLRLESTAVVGDARRLVSVTLLERGGTAPTVLQSGLHSGAGVTLNGAGGAIEARRSAISSGGLVTYDADVIGDINASTAGGTGQCTGTVTTGLGAPTLPPDEVADLYAAMGTPLVGIGSTIEDLILAPGRNPYGDLDPDGIYTVSVAAGTTLRIRDVRIVGTMVVELADGASLELRNGILWEPATADMPALIVRGAGTGAVSIQLDPEISESALGINLNPSDLAYKLVDDVDATDVYESRISGLVHILGTKTTTTLGDGFVLRGALVCDGPLVVETGGAGGFVRVERDWDLHLNPPIGYGVDGEPVLAHGSWRWEVDP